MAAAIIYAGIIGGLNLLLRTFGAAIYDIQADKAAREQQKHPQARFYRMRPNVTVIIYAANDAEVIQRCLYSLKHNSYKKLKIVVIDNASTDGTNAAVKSFIKINQRLNIKVITKRRAVSRALCFKDAVQRYTKDELVLCLHADSVLDKCALQKAVIKLNKDSSLESVAFNEKPSSVVAFAGLLQALDYEIRHQGQKYHSTSHGLYQSSLTSSLFRKPAVKKLYRNDYVKTAYSADSLIYIPPAQSVISLLSNRFKWQNRAASLPFSKLLFRPARSNWYLAMVRTPLTVLNATAALLMPVLIAYFSYVALQLHQPTFYIYTCLGFGLLIFSAVLYNRQLSGWSKVSYILLLPLIQLGIFLAALVQIPSVLNGVFRQQFKESF